MMLMNPIHENPVLMQKYFGKSEMELEGYCPRCKEWTRAGESCCGLGAVVEGGLISDESVQESEDADRN